MLIEILFWIELVGSIVSMLIVWELCRWSSFGPSKHKDAEKDIANLMSSVEMYRLSKARCPESLVDLREAKIIAKLTKDPWGNDYAFTCAGAPEHVFIMSAGPDGRFGSKDDIKSWDSDP